MKRLLRIVVTGMVLMLGIVAQSHAQNLVQPLIVSLTAYDTSNNQPLRIGTRELIAHLTGTNVPNGRLYLVTPAGNTPGQIGNLGAFIRITSGTKTVLEIPSPSQFNVYQDAATLKTNGTRIAGHALNRFSIDSGSVRAELQGLSTWNISLAPVSGVDTSGAGWFLSSVNGWIGIHNVTQQFAPASGAILAGPPKAGP